MLAFLELSTSGIPQLHTDSECSESPYDFETKRMSGEVVVTLTLYSISHLTPALCMVDIFHYRRIAAIFIKYSDRLEQIV